MELSNDSFLSLLEEHILKRDGNSGKKLIPAGHTVFYTLSRGARPPEGYKNISSWFTLAGDIFIYLFNNIQYS